MSKEEEFAIHVLITALKLAGLDDDSSRKHAQAPATLFLQVLGLVSRIWLAAVATHTSGSVYCAVRQ